MKNAIFVSCPRGVESLLMEESETLGLTSLSETVGGVWGEGDIETAYRLCLWSRLASRVYWVLVKGSVSTMETLEQHLKTIDFTDHLKSSGSFLVNFSGKLKDVDNEIYGAQRVKDQLVDQFRDKLGVRPEVKKERPDIVLTVRVRKGQAMVALDLSGEALHRRGYRLKGSKAPLKENLAAALLLRAGWPAIANKGGALIDPMCGSGTFLIEAGWIAGDRAPGLTRQYFGFLGWKQHQPSLWMTMVTNARERRASGLESIPVLLGYDADYRVIQAANENIERAGLKGKAWAYQKELAHWKQPTHIELKPGLLITNPPYGERLGDINSLRGLYRYLGDLMKRELPGWKASVFTGNPDLGKRMGIRAIQQYRLLNASIDCKLLNFSIEQEYFVGPTANGESDNKGISKDQLNDGATMFCNRVEKNVKQLQRWLKKDPQEAYRIYDADIPEYSVAVDQYQDWLHVAEYQAPANIPEEKTRQRLMDVLDALPAATGVSPDHIIIKERSRQKGKSQYTRQNNQQQTFVITENGVQLLVNLTDYLDTGVFLDHRPIRKTIQSLSKGKRFLNLYCYTGAATVHAAKGGAHSTVSIDLSNTYLNWVRKNLDLNGFSESKHSTVQADCKAWLSDPKNKNVVFDLIFMDPPTFSNSKRMKDVLDIQRDHSELISLAMAHLSPDGLLIFSNNRRQFRLDEQVQTEYQVEDVTRQSIPEDFKRNQKIHRCWYIRHRLNK